MSDCYEIKIGDFKNQIHELEIDDLNERINKLTIRNESLLEIIIDLSEINNFLTNKGGGE